MSPRLLFSRVLCAAGLVLATITVLSTIAAPANAEPTTDRSQAAAGWLARQLVDGDHFTSEYDGQVFPDQGLTIDAVLAFAAAGVADESAGKAMTWLARSENLGGYVGDGATESYAGAHAKLLLALEVRGLDPTSFGGINVAERLTALLRAEPDPQAGRFSDKSAYGDYSNTFSQSLAIIGLSRSSHDAPATASTFLAGQQCADGGFPVQFGQQSCASDVDATALAVQALRLSDDDAANGAADKGLTWLVSAQRSDGGFLGGAPANTPNANSTGLAAQALKGNGYDTQADKAVDFLVSLQVGCVGAEADRGAIAAQTTGFDKATATRATAQAVLGLSGVGLAELTAQDSTSDLPTLDCAGQPSPTPTTSPSAPPTTAPAPSTPAISPSTKPTTVVKAGATTKPSVAKAPANPPRTSSLAKTGDTTLPMLWTSAGLMVAGLVMMTAARRAATRSQRLQ